MKRQPRPRESKRVPMELKTLMGWMLIREEDFNALPVEHRLTLVVGAKGHLRRRIPWA